MNQIYNIIKPSSFQIAVPFTPYHHLDRIFTARKACKLIYDIVVDLYFAIDHWRGLKIEREKIMFDADVRCSVTTDELTTAVRLSKNCYSHRSLADILLSCYKHLAPM